jgi:hypothetical protein
MSKTYSNTDTKTRWTKVLMKGKQFFYLKRQWTCYSVKSTTFFEVIDVQHYTMTMIWLIVMRQESVPQVSYIKEKLYNPQFEMNDVVICK